MEDRHRLLYSGCATLWKFLKRRKCICLGDCISKTSSASWLCELVLDCRCWTTCGPPCPGGQSVPVIFKVDKSRHLPASNSRWWFPCSWTHLLEWAGATYRGHSSPKLASKVQKPTCQQHHHVACQPLPLLCLAGQQKIGPLIPYQTPLPTPRAKSMRCWAISHEWSPLAAAVLSCRTHMKQSALAAWTSVTSLL